MESRFGHDFSRVRVHTDARAAESARAVNATAYTVGRHVVFEAAAYAPETVAGRRLLAHELAHVVQQSASPAGRPTAVAPPGDAFEREADRAASAVVDARDSGLSVSSGGSLATHDGISGGQRVYRYEAGEHARMGETQAELQKAFRPVTYTVKTGETLEEIAGKFGLTVQELKEVNKALLKTWSAADGSGRQIVGFNAGESISIPQKLNDLAQMAVKDKSAKFSVNGVMLEYGVVIAMGDLYESPEQLAKAPPVEIQALSDLVKREQGGKPVKTEEWQKATGGRYSKLAEKNEGHFAPPDPAIASASPAGASAPTHKSEWERHHRAALDASKAGDKDKAFGTNAFGDHFLTDAFSAGHLVNKRDVMEQFKSHLKLDPKSHEFTGPSQKFFDDVAKDSFTGGVKTEFSKYESVKTYYGVHPDIDRESRFSTLLQEIHKVEPDLLGSAAAKGVHDTLNERPGGLPVTNAKGDSWALSGDGTLNAKTLEIARAAVAQSQLNVISAFKSTMALAYTALFKKVWDHTPQPDKAGQSQVKDAVDKGTDINSADLRKAVAGLIKANYLVIIDELVKRKHLTKA